MGQPSTTRTCETYEAADENQLAFKSLEFCILSPEGVLNFECHVEMCFLYF